MVVQSCGRNGAIPVYFTDEFLSRLYSFLVEREGADLKLKHIQSELNESVMISSGKLKTALYFLVTGQRTLIIRYVLLEHRRVGTLTTILDMLREQLVGMGADLLCVESVLTPQMHSWCRKNGMVTVNPIKWDSLRYGISYIGSLYPTINKELS